MSSPVNDDQDKRYMYAPPWAREVPQQPPEAIVAAVERLRLERQRKAASTGAEGQTAQRAAEQARQTELPLTARPEPADDPADIEAALANAIRSTKWTPHSLDPVAMPEPPKPRMDGPSWGMVLRLGGAVTAAAVAALMATGAVRLPSIQFSLSSGESAKAASSAVQALGIPDARATRQPTAVAEAAPAAAPPATPLAAQPSGPAPAPAAAVPSAGLPTQVLTAYASLDAKPAGVSLTPRSDGAVAAAQIKLPEERQLDRDELAGLVTRGQALLSEGDIASARLLLRRAAEAGDVNAALALAGTYDRAELARLNVIGVAPDAAQAKLWYTKAVEHGSAEAVRRLQQLAQRAE